MPKDTYFDVVYTSCAFDIVPYPSEYPETWLVLERVSLEELVDLERRIRRIRLSQKTEDEETLKCPGAE